MAAIPDFVLDNKIRKLIDLGVPLYWVFQHPHYAELRGVTYIYENGKERTKLIRLFDLTTQLRDIVLTTSMFTRPRVETNATYCELLEDAYWMKIIPFHPGSDDFLLNVLGKETLEALKCTL
jgi:hypothetical protein